MASTSDRFDGILHKKHADAAAIGLIPIACHLSTVLSGKLLIVGSYSLYSWQEWLHASRCLEDGADVVEIVLRRANDLRIVRHGDLTDRVTYSPWLLNLRLSDRLGITPWRGCPSSFPITLSVVHDECEVAKVVAH